MMVFLVRSRRSQNSSLVNTCSGSPFQYGILFCRPPSTTWAPLFQINPSRSTATIQRRSLRPDFRGQFGDRQLSLLTFSTTLTLRRLPMLRSRYVRQDLRREAALWGSLFAYRHLKSVWLAYSRAASAARQSHEQHPEVLRDVSET